MAKKGRIPPPKQSKVRNNIPLSASVNDKMTDAVQDTVHFSFASYRLNLCEIDQLPEATARKALRQLKNIGMGDARNLNSSNVKPRKVSRTSKGDYSKLFEGLTPDVSIMEFDISSGGRCFYYRVQNRFFIRAFRENHLRA